MKKKGWFIGIIVVIIVGAIIGGELYLDYKEKVAYEASIIEIEAEILDYEHWLQESNWLKLKKVDTGEEPVVKFKNLEVKVYPYYLPDLPKINKDYVPNILELNGHELGTGSIYRIKYAGTEDGEAKDLLEIELIQPRKEWVAKQAQLNERPNINNWVYIDNANHVYFEVKTYSRFNVFENQKAADILCFAYYDNKVNEEPTPEALDVWYISSYSYFYKKSDIAARKIWIKNNEDWTVYDYNLKDEDRTLDVIPGKDFSVEFRFHNTGEWVRQQAQKNEMPDIKNWFREDWMFAQRGHDYLLECYSGVVSVLGTDCLEPPEKGMICARAYRENVGYPIKAVNIYYYVIPQPKEPVLIARKVGIKKDEQWQYYLGAKEDKRNIYAIRQNGQLEFEFLHNLEEWVKEQAKSKKMPYTDDWYHLWRLKDGDSEAVSIMKFEPYYSANIIGFIEYQYDNEGTPHQKSLLLYYVDSSLKVFAENLWIKKDGQWKFYHQNLKE